MLAKNFFRIPYPRPQNLAYPARVLSNEGRFMRRSEVGQSESWPEGQDKSPTRAPPREREVAAVLNFNQHIRKTSTKPPPSSSRKRGPMPSVVVTREDISDFT